MAPGNYRNCTTVTYTSDGTQTYSYIEDEMYGYVMLPANANTHEDLPPWKPPVIDKVTENAQLNLVKHIQRNSLPMIDSKLLRWMARTQRST